MQRNPAKPAQVIRYQPHDKETAILKEIKEMQIDMENLKKSILSETNMRSLESDLVREFQKLSKEVRGGLERNRHAVDKMEAEIKFLKEDVGRIMGLEEQMNRLNMKSLTRDMESLKAKSNWLEGKIGTFDLDPVVERISDIESKIKILKAAQPFIIE